MKNFYLSKRVGFIATLMAIFMSLCGSIYAADVTWNIGTQGSLTIAATSTDNYIITGTTTTNRVVVSSGYHGTITLRNLSITLSGSLSPFLVQGQNNCSNYSPVTEVDIILDGDNYLLFYGSTAAALQVDQGAQIKISSVVPRDNNSGKLTAKAHNYTPGASGSYSAGAGIGAASYSPQGTSTIKNSSGTTIKTGNTSGGNIIITGGTITAYGSHGAGIGGGYTTYYNGFIIITGGKIEARGGFDSAGIGSGCPEGTGVLQQFAENSTIVALPPCEITAYGAGARTTGGVGTTQFVELGLNGTKYLTYVNDPAKPLVTIRTVDYEKNADIYLDLTETEGLQDIFDAVYPEFALNQVWIGKTTNTDALMQVHGLFQDITTFFTDASSSAPGYIGRPYLPVSQRTSGAETIVLPIFQADISFYDNKSTPLVEGYTTAQATQNAYVLKIVYHDTKPLTGLTFALQNGSSSDFRELKFLAADSSTVTAAPTQFVQNGVYYIVVPIKDGKPVGEYTDVILIKGTFDGAIMAGYIRRISDQIVVKDDTETNTYIKVTANPVTFSERYPTSKTVTLTLDINHTGLTTMPYDPTAVTAKYLITTESSYSAALAATPLASWPALNIPATASSATTTVSFAGKPAGVYYIHWYVVSSYILAHSKDVTDPARTYGGFGKYTIVAGSGVTYNGNTSTGGTVPVDATLYTSGATVTVKGNTGTLVKTGAVFLGWTLTQKALITTAAAEPVAPELKVAGSTFVIGGTDTTLYAVWAQDVKGPSGGSDGIPDYKEYGITYSDAGKTGGTAPVDNNIYPSGGSATVKDEATLVKEGYTFIGWSATPVSPVTTQAEEDRLTIINPGDAITVTGPITLYPIWAIDASGPNGTSDDVPDYKQGGVTYNPNGSTGGSAPVDNKLYNPGDNATVKDKNTLVNDGATFIGWSETPEPLVTTQAQEDAIDPITPGSTIPVNGDKELYAVWAEDTNGPNGTSDGIPDYKEYGITYSDAGKTSGSAPVDNNIYPAGGSASVKDKGTLVKDGYKFIGWSETPVSPVTTQAEEDAVTIVTPGSSITVNGPVTLYPVWAIDENGPGGGSDGVPDYKEAGVTYTGTGADSGTPPVDNNLYNVGDNANVKDKNDLAKDDAVFIGWTPTTPPALITTQAGEDAIASSLVQPGDNIPVNGSVVLSPVWAEDAGGPNGTSDGVPDYKQGGITYSDNGSTSGTAPVDNNLYTFGTKAKVKAKGSLVKTGAAFIGWSTTSTSLITTAAAESALTLIQANDSITINSPATTLYAVWAEDLGGPAGVSDGVPDYKQFSVTYNANGSTSGTAPVDNKLYNNGNNVTLLPKGDLAKSGYMFYGWSSTLQSPLTADPSFPIVQPGETFPISANSTWYAVWASDNLGGISNGIPDWKEITINYDKGNGVTATGLPKTEIIEEGSTIILTTKNAKWTNYVLIGWTIAPTKLPLLITDPLTKVYGTQFLVVGDSITNVAAGMTLNAVWGRDANNDGIFDFTGSLPASQSSVRSAQMAKSSVYDEADAVSLRSSAVPSYLPTWDEHYDQTAYNDAVYYTGCTYRQFGYMAGMSINPLYRLREPVLLTDGIFNNVITYITTPMNLIIEYDGVLRNKSIIGGKAQKALDKIEITAAMIASSSSIIGQPGYPVDSVLDAYSFTIMEDAITEDGVGIVKIYFIDPATGTYPTQTDFQTTGGALMSSAGAWPKPFRNPETGSNSDVMTYKFKVYNNPEVENTVLRQYVTTDGYLKDLKVLSGTPLKYMMRSTQGQQWIQADKPLTSNEIFVMADAGSICFREMDENTGLASWFKDYYISDAYAEAASGTPDGAFADAWFVATFLDSIYMEHFDGFVGSAPSLAWATTTLSGQTFSTIHKWYTQEYQDWYDFEIAGGSTPEVAEVNAKATTLIMVFTYFELDVFPSGYSTTGRALWYWGGGPSACVVDSAQYARFGSNYQVEVTKLMGAEVLNNGLPTPSRCRETFCLKFDSVVNPDIQRWVEINTIAGVSSDPADGIRHFVEGHQDFTFTLTFSGGAPLKVMAEGFYSGIREEILGKSLGGGRYEYTLIQVVEPWTITVSSELASDEVGIMQIAAGTKVWSFQNKLYISSDSATPVNIYSINGMLTQKPKVSAGLTSVTLERGLYIVEIKGIRYKVIIK